ncbi:RNA helicase, partial [Rhodococcus erythropolis]|nr:RNA helicase [Rhodococcus erythropolis]
QGNRDSRPSTGYQGNRTSGGYQGNRDGGDNRAASTSGGGFRSRTDRRSYDGFDGPKREQR